MDDEPLLILTAGPCRSGTDGDPQAMAADPARLEAAARPVVAAGHLPVIGERLALPVLRSAGAGQDVATARRRGLPVHHDVAGLPRRTPQESA
ncbi:DUF4406 domain-containing protein [Streptomyces sp. NPDC006284]|uniref:DUF4406 domain-containing protein n=1 Tax=Streptomyces sp. NPDC006284 TaxID=3156742 RepID=UPI0033BB840A